MLNTSSLPKIWRFLTSRFQRSENSNLSLVLKIFDHRYYLCLCGLMPLRGVDVNTIRNQSDEENLAPVHVAAVNNLCKSHFYLIDHVSRFVEVACCSKS